jgi:hypothetical protein
MRATARGVGHSSCVSAGRPSMGVMSSIPTGPRSGAIHKRLASRSDPRPRRPAAAGRPGAFGPRSWVRQCRAGHLCDAALASLTPQAHQIVYSADRVRRPVNATRHPLPNHLSAMGRRVHCIPPVRRLPSAPDDAARSDPAGSLSARGLRGSGPGAHAVEGSAGRAVR